MAPPPKEDPSATSALWVGNLPASATDAGVMATFSGRAALDCVTMRGGARSSYAFVMFRSPEDARAARDALQGGTYAGADDASSGPKLRIEFARPPRASRHVWIGGISKSITKEELEEEFSKHGKIEYFAFFRDRNSALIDYHNMDAAMAAVKSLNGKTFGGEQLVVDFQRSQAPRMEWPNHDGKTGIGRGASGAVGPGALHTGSLGRRQGPSKVLWIGYPASLKIDEEMLHNAMILFGEIERISCYPERHFSFVEFRSVDEARRAKEGLQGRLFKDPRIQIEYSNSNPVPEFNNLTSFPRHRGSGLSMFLKENHLEPLDHSEISGSANFPGSLSGLSGLANAVLGGSGYHNTSGLPSNKSILTSLRQRSPTAAGILPLPDIYSTLRSGPDALDTRDAKRLKANPYLSDTSGRLSESRGTPYLDRGASSERHLSPSVQSQRLTPDAEFCWRGTLAKGGSFVCRARCVPYGKGVDAPFPEIVNCSARTGLDMLTKHFTDALDFGVVFFLPDSEEDFASYTEFLFYLRQKDRAGVAKLDDGTTLFLVPPSDFLTNVLKVDGPDRLYGVVLDLPQQQGAASVHQQQLSARPVQSSNSVREDATSLLNSQSVISQDGNQNSYDGYHMESLRSLTGAIPFNSSNDGRSEQSASVSLPDKQETAPQVKVSLTPELIASLVSLVPGNTQASASAALQISADSVGRAVTSGVHDSTIQGFRQDFQGAIATGHEQQTGFPHHLAQQLSMQASLVPQLPNYGNFLNTQEHSSLLLTSGPETQNMSLNMAPSLPHVNLPPPPPLAPVVSNSLGSTSYGGNYVVPQTNQPYYNVNTPLPTQSGHTMLQTPALSNIYDPATQQQQVQNLYSVSTQDSSLQSNDSEAAKTERFRQTLALAARMLHQMQQGDQTGGGQPVQGFGNQP